jgi:hypothetical protein
MKKIGKGSVGGFGGNAPQVHTRALERMRTFILGGTRR